MHVYCHGKMRKKKKICINKGMAASTISCICLLCGDESHVLLINDVKFSVKKRQQIEVTATLGRLINWMQFYL